MRASSSRLSSFSSRDSLWSRMPDQISVSEFLSETTEDYNSPTTSSFTTRLQSCRNTVSVLEEAGRGYSPEQRFQKCGGNEAEKRLTYFHMGQYTPDL
ncbi:arf-GAP with SH3 domain, ANK repeat and PH domain-containing protein 1a isoform X1 [Tachysurus ichikawai]